MELDEGLSCGSDEDVDPVVDPQAYAEAAAKQTSSLPVNVVASLVPVIVMAAQGAGAFSTADGEGDRFDELITSSGKPAPKTIVEQASSKLTGCIISALDDAHAADLEKNAPRFRLVAYKLANVRTSGDSRALSFIDGINNLSIDSRFFPTGDFNCHEATHRHVLAWVFLTFFKLWIPLKDASHVGLDFRIINTSLTKASTKLKGGHGATRAITGIVVTFEARTTAHDAWSLELDFLPKHIPPENLPLSMHYADPPTGMTLRSASR
jgi:hypothetical protein